MIRILSLLLVAFLTYVPLRPALAFEDAVEVTVLPGWRLADGQHMAALRMQLKPGWKTYWRSPGDAGIPPRFDWHASGNLKAVDMIWPAPSVSVDYGLRTIGYQQELILPMRLTPSRAGGDVKLKGRVEIGVCKDVCVPVDLRVSARLNGATTQPDPRIVAALASQPFSASDAGVKAVSCRIDPRQDGVGLRAAINLPRQGGQEIVVVEVSDPDIWVAQAKTTRQGGQLVAETRLSHVDGRAFALNRSEIRLTVIGQGQAVDIQGCPAG